MSYLKCNSCEVSLTTFMISQSHVANFQALHSPLIWCKRPNQASAEGNRLPKGNTKTDYAENIMRTKQKNSTNGVKRTQIAFPLMASCFIWPQQWKSQVTLLCAAQIFTWLGNHEDIYSTDSEPPGFPQLLLPHSTFCFLVGSAVVEREHSKTWHGTKQPTSPFSPLESTQNIVNEQLIVMETKSVGKHVGSSEAGRNEQLSHQEARIISPCNSASSIVILGNVMSLFVIKSTGCALNMQHMMKFSH